MAAPLPNVTHDLTLAARLRAAEPAAMSEVYAQHGPALLRAATYLSGSLQDGEDLVQDLFVGLPEAIAKYDGTGSLAGWLRRVVVRLALMRLRTGHRRREESGDAADHLAAGPGIDHALGDRLNIERALRALPDGLREVFVLKELEGYRHAEIAGLLGIRVNTAQVRLHRARLLLRQLLEDHR